MKHLESSYANWCSGRDKAEAPESFSKKGFSPSLPTDFSQLFWSWWANQTEVPGTLTSSKKLLVRIKSICFIIRKKRTTVQSREQSWSVTFSRYEHLSGSEPPWRQCCEVAAWNPLLLEEIQKSALFLCQKETATATVIIWRRGKKIMF